MNATTPTPARSTRLERFRVLAVGVLAAAGADSVEAAVHSETGLDLPVGVVGGVSTDRTLAITDGGGATVASLSWRSSYATTVGGNWLRRVAATGAGVAFRTLSQSALVGTLRGGVPVASGASWSATGRTSGEFIGVGGFGIGGDGGIQLSTSAWSDFQQVAGGGVSYLLFRFAHGGGDAYGWISFAATIEGFGGDDNLVRITGWGCDDSGEPIAAGFTGQAVPGGGLATLAAAGAVGLRRRRRRR